MRRWIALIFASLIVPVAHAQQPRVQVSKFLVGTWNRAIWENAPDKEGANWAAFRNCDDERGSAVEAHAAGIRISDDGRITANSGSWACLLTKLEELPGKSTDRGPRWSFSASCDEIKRDESSNPSAVFKLPVPLSKRETGSIELKYAGAKGEWSQMLRIWFDRPPTSGGLLNLFPADLLGPYVRCSPS
jgi:hypothetical protein